MIFSFLQDFCNVFNLGNLPVVGGFRATTQISHQRPAVRSEDTATALEQQKKASSKLFAKSSFEGTDAEKRNSKLIWDQLPKDGVPKEIKNSKVCPTERIEFFDGVSMSDTEKGNQHILSKHGHDWPGLENEQIPPEKTGIEPDPKYPKAHIRTKVNKKTLAIFRAAYIEKAKSKDLEVYQNVTMKGDTSDRIYVDPKTRLALGGPWEHKANNYVVRVGYKLGEDQYFRLQDENILML